jgi:hypothetical protein
MLRPVDALRLEASTVVASRAEPLLPGKGEEVALEIVRRRPAVSPRRVEIGDLVQVPTPTYHPSPSALSLTAPGSWAGLTGRAPAPAEAGGGRGSVSRRREGVRGEIAVGDPLNALRQGPVRLDELLDGSERFFERDVEADGPQIIVERARVLAKPAKVPF